MQIINQPSNGQYNAVFSTAATVVIIPAATNVRGVIIDSTFYSWFISNTSQIVRANIMCITELAHGINDDNGPTGPVNVPKTAVFSNRIQFSAGQDISFNSTNTGATQRLSVTINYRIL